MIQLEGLVVHGHLTDSLSQWRSSTVSPNDGCLNTGVLATIRANVQYNSRRIKLSGFRVPSTHFSFCWGVVFEPGLGLSQLLRRNTRSCIFSNLHTVGSVALHLIHNVYYINLCLSSIISYL